MPTRRRRSWATPRSLRSRRSRRASPSATTSAPTSRRRPASMTATPRNSSSTGGIAAHHDQRLRGRARGRRRRHRERARSPPTTGVEDPRQGRLGHRRQHRGARPRQAHLPEGERQGRLPPARDAGQGGKRRHGGSAAGARAGHRSKQSPTVRHDSTTQPAFSPPSRRAVLAVFPAIAQHDRPLLGLRRQGQRADRGRRQDARDPRGGRQRISTFSGGVTVRRGNTTMKAAQIKLFSKKESDADRPVRLHPHGGDRDGLRQLRQADDHRIAGDRRQQGRRPSRSPAMWC